MVDPGVQVTVAWLLWVTWGEVYVYGYSLVGLGYSVTGVRTLIVVWGSKNLYIVFYVEHGISSKCVLGFVGGF